MPGFAKTETRGVILWVGDPDCQAAHDATLHWLQENCPAFCPAPSATDNILKGNLGETITFCVGYWYVFNSSHVHAFSANALNPFGGISKADIDIVWICFGETGEDDTAILQEVKTTGEPSLSLADGLISDYDKLFEPTRDSPYICGYRVSKTPSSMSTGGLTCVPAWQNWRGNRRKHRLGCFCSRPSFMSAMPVIRRRKCWRSEKHCVAKDGLVELCNLGRLVSLISMCGCLGSPWGSTNDDTRAVTAMA